MKHIIRALVLISIIISLLQQSGGGGSLFNAEQAINMSGSLGPVTICFQPTINGQP